MTSSAARLVPGAASTGRPVIDDDHFIEWMDFAYQPLYGTLDSYRCSAIAIDPYGDIAGTVVEGHQFDRGLEIGTVDEEPPLEA